MLDTESQGDFFSARETRTQRDRPGRFLLHADDQIHLVRGSWHFLGIHPDFREKAQTVHSITRKLDLVAVVPRGLKLAEFAANHFVAGAIVARHLNASHIRTARRFGTQHKSDTIVFTIDFRHCFDTRKSEAKLAEVVRESLRGFCHQIGVVRLTRANFHQGLELVLALKVVAFQLHARDHEFFTFVDVDHQGDFLLVWRNRHLRGLNPEIEVPALQVIGTQCFQVRIQLTARIAIRLGIPAQPAARVLVELLLEGGFAERLVADDANVVDLRGLAFGHRESQVDTVALNRCDGGHDLRAIQAAVDVLALEFLLGAIGQSLVERTTFCQAHIPHRLLQRFLVELFGTDKVHAGNRGALFHHHHQDVAIGFQADVFKKPQGKQRANRSGPLVVVVFIANTQRHGGEHGTCFDTLQAFDADVLDLERLESPSPLGQTEQRSNRRGSARAKSIKREFHVRSRRQH